MLLPGSPFTRESRSTAAPERARVRPPLLRQVMDYDVALTLADGKPHVREVRAGTADLLKVLLKDTQVL